MILLRLDRGYIKLLKPLFGWEEAEQVYQVVILQQQELGIQERGEICLQRDKQDTKVYS